MAKEQDNAKVFAFGVFFCAKIEPKMEKIQKTIRNQGFFYDFLSILTVFEVYSIFRNSSAKTEQIYP